jgi:hypothetical protein
MKLTNNQYIKVEKKIKKIKDFKNKKIEQEKRLVITTDKSNENHFKNIYLNEKIQYILNCMQEERDELRSKTEDLYKLIVEYEKYEEKEQEFIQIKLDFENENKLLKEKNEKLLKVMFKFLVSFEKEINEYKNRENVFKIKEEKYLAASEEYKYLALD